MRRVISPCYEYLPKPMSLQASLGWSGHCAVGRPLAAPGQAGATVLAAALEPKVLGSRCQYKEVVKGFGTFGNPIVPGISTLWILRSERVTIQHPTPVVDSRQSCMNKLYCAVVLKFRVLRVM